MDQQTIQTYNLMAREYDEETKDFWERFPKAFFDEFASLTAHTVLDLGSGPGRDGLLLKERGLEVTCLDASTAMLALCKEKNLTTVLGDFKNIPLNDSSFDSVWAYTSLLHIPKSEMPQALQEIHRVLQPHGILGLGLIEGTTEGYRESSGVDKPRWFSYYTKAEIENLLRSHGFEIISFNQFNPKTKNYLHFIAKKI